MTNLAFDHRARFYLGAKEARTHAALHGGVAWEAFDFPPRLVDEFFGSLEKTLSGVEPRRLLASDAEDRLLRHCVVLALLEQLYRAGPQIINASPLATFDPRSISGLLAIADAERLSDLRLLGERLHARFSTLPLDKVVIGPVFSGSRDVGGADGDLILDGCLVDIKVSSARNAKTTWMRQQIGYALLDYEDAFDIRRVGFYLARQGRLLSWPISEVLCELAGDDSASLGALRKEFRQALTRANRAARSGFGRPSH